MKKRIYVLLVAVLASFVAICQKVNVIPQPAVVEVANGKGFVMNGTTTLYIDKSMSRMPAVEFLQESFSSAFGTKLRTIDKKKLKNKDLKNAIIFVRVSDKTLKDEGYQLDINKDKIVVQANENAGFFYALQSICQLSEGQLLPGHLTLWQDEKINPATTSITLPSCSITDYPRFAY